jgi:nucleoside 2-deoxyribosyltransferase
MMRLGFSYAILTLEVVTARKIRNALSRHSTAKIVLSEDFGMEGKRTEIKASDAACALLTPTSIHSAEVNQEVGMAFALDIPILPLVSRTDVFNYFSSPLRRDLAVQFELGDLCTLEGAERIAATIYKAIREILATSIRADASSVGALSR